MEALFESLIKIVNSPIFQEELGLLCGIETEREKLSSLLSTTKAMLEDAEQKQFTDKAIQLWLQKLNLIAYEVDDILDDYATEVSREHKSKNICCNVLDCLPATSNIWFRHRIGAKMKKINGKFDAVADERIKLGLSDQKHGSNRYLVDSTATRETGSLLNEPDLVLGRDGEKEKIVEILVNQVSDNQNVSVLPVVGVGGLGKTTFAQLLFKDERIAKHFEPKLWVWVSEEFDVNRIIQALIVSAKGSCTEAYFDPLQRKLRELLSGNRYLLVLDDVWNDNQEEWEKLKSVLACGSRGSSIVATTRIKKVAEIMGTLQTHYLSILSDRQCWLLFRQRAFGHQEAEDPPNLVDIGKEIVKKCGGVPLAAKALGGFLRFKTEAEWNSVKCSALWNLGEEEKHILPALKLSYINLPVELRGCFAYCAVFPKGYEIEKEEVIHGWMANGLISSKGTMEVEDVGDAVLTQLCYRSLLLQAKRHVHFNRVHIVYKMHDLVHDLAQSIMEGKHKGTESDNTIRHLTLKGTDQYSSFLSRRGSLREFIARPTEREKKLTELSPAISNLKHLRHLNLSGSDIVKLPNSICDLWNLQILNLNRCRKLRGLPKDMRFLRNLRHLCLEECRRLTHMPSGIAELTCLRTLSMVVPSDKKGFQLSELGDLNNLRGTLAIRQLARTEDKKDAEAANLIAKQSLLKLHLEWDSFTRSQPNNDEEVAEALKPCPNLQFLKIKRFKGSSFPLWISTLQNVVEIELRECRNSTRLTVLGHLPHLQRLKVVGGAAEYIVDDDEQTVPGAQEEGTAAAAWFPSLTELSLRNMPNLKGMLRTEVGTTTSTSTREAFPRLQFLSCSNCPMLTSPLPRMLSLEELKVDKCPSNMAWASISDLTNLESLTISGIEGLSCFPEEMLQNLTLLRNLDFWGIRDLRALPSRSLASLTALEMLTINKCPELMKSLPGEGLQGFASLRVLQLDRCDNVRLVIEDCHELDSLPEGGLQGLASLQKLYLRDCHNLVSLSMGTKALESLTTVNIQESSATTLPEVLKQIPTQQTLILSNFPNLTSLPDWFGRDYLASLQDLTLLNCPKLETLPSSIQMMTTLQSLSVWNCELLGPRCARRGAEWHKIKHIPYVSVDWNNVISYFL